MCQDKTNLRDLFFLQNLFPGGQGAAGLGAQFLIFLLLSGLGLLPTVVRIKQKQRERGRGQGYPHKHQREGKE